MMQLSDGTILMHDGAPYDPAKAHEYYLKYRKLHPRQAATDDKKTKVKSFTVDLGKGHTVKLSPKQLAEQKVYAAQRVSAIQKQLVELNDKLKKKLAAATKAEEDAKKGPTAAEKAQAAKDQKAYDAKHKTTIAAKAKVAASKAPKKTTASTKSTSGGTVVEIRAEIIHAKNNLKDAVAKQRELATAKANG